MQPVVVFVARSLHLANIDTILFIQRKVYRTCLYLDRAISFVVFSLFTVNEKCSYCD